MSYLVRNAGRVVTHDSLAAILWGTDEFKDADTQAIKVHIQQLRSKLGDSASNPEYIGTIYGMGYKFLKQVMADDQLHPSANDNPANMNG